VTVFTFVTAILANVVLFSFTFNVIEQLDFIKGVLSILATVCCELFQELTSSMGHTANLGDTVLNKAFFATSVIIAD